MQTVRRAQNRGQASYGWLESAHTFSFADYYDPQFMGFGALRVINDDRVKPGYGFPTHPHRDMEIISYVVEGALQHKDSLGNGSTIKPGEVQRMTAGTGVTHSEFNPSQQDALRFLQIWIVPNQRRLQPGYEQKDFGEQRRNQLRLVASQDGRDGSLSLNQDVDLYASLLDAGKQVEHQLTPERMAWLQVVTGELDVSGKQLREGDGLAVTEEDQLRISATLDSNFLLFELQEAA